MTWRGGSTQRKLEASIARDIRAAPVAILLAESSTIPPRPVTVCYYQLEIYGGEYEITELEAGSLYFTRVFAKNQMVGWGEASLTTPVSMIPMSAPEVRAQCNI